jgi:hypothetical protein
LASKVSKKLSLQNDTEREQAELQKAYLVACGNNVSAWDTGAVSKQRLAEVER